MPVSYPNKSEPETLPDPELNPLLNPLLAAHMGRWAEVYFTNPPEKRDQAVSELLRELENVPPEPAPVEDVPDEHAKENTETADSPNWSSSTLPAVLTCNECAYNNSPDHEFCGMCGAPLVEWAERGLPQVAETAPIGESWCERTLGGKPSPNEDRVEDAAEDVIEPEVSSAIAAARREAMELNGLLPEPGPKLVPKLVPKPPPRKDPHPRVGSLPRFYGFYRYHLYVGIGLAILLVVASFMAWRGRDTHFRATAVPAASAIPQPQAAPVDSTPPPNTSASALPTTQPASPVASPAASPVPSPVASPVQSQASASPPPARVPDSRIAPPNVPVVAVSSAVVPPEQSGAEELAMAERYLNPTRGTARDSGEAAEWLWKAVRKRNLEATLALSDLYARGDGVTKSCDQARLLLDAAARKGGKGAGVRLRNLEAFGCQ
jgi:hypothetical protein